MYFLETFDIDGMLLEFFMNFLNKKNIFLFFFWGGGGGVLNFFLEKQFFHISRFMLFSTLKK